MSTRPERARYALAAESGILRPSGKAPLRCTECGYEIVRYAVVPPCPMCRELSWEPAPWRPFTRARGS
jgi:predicted Zn-ribbon and HTH transcriptional regulator